MYYFRAVMRRYTYTVFFAAALLLSGGASAQSGQSLREAGRKMRAKVQSTMQYADDRTDTVIMIQMDFLRESRKARLDETLSSAARKKQINTLRSERDAKLQSTLHLSPADLKKLQGILPDQLIKK